MLARLSKLAAMGVLLIVVGMTRCIETTGPDGQKTDAEVEEEIKYITMEDIDDMIERQEFEALASGEGGLRKLDETCWHTGQDDQNLSWLGRNWGNCKNLDPCVCGLNPRRMAAWCATKCRPSCNGKCATQNTCRDGFNIENNQVVPYDHDALLEEKRSADWNEWPESYGQKCWWYENVGAPGYTAPPPSAPQSIRGASGLCLGLNEVCGEGTPCCGSFYCGEKLSDSTRRCARKSYQDLLVQVWTPEPSPIPPTPAPVPVPAQPANPYDFFCFIPKIFGGCS